MPSELSAFAARLREMITSPSGAGFDFPALALRLFRLQYTANPLLRRLCDAARMTPESVEDWRSVPAVPTAAFKEFEVTCLAPAERAHVFHSSGTTERQPSRHFHSSESLAIYEASLWSAFTQAVLPDIKSEILACRFVFLTPPSGQSPHSSLVHMFETIRRHCAAPETAFLGFAGKAGEWLLDFDRLIPVLRKSAVHGQPQIILGTAFSFVHLLEFMTRQELRFHLPPGSRVMETGGYKGRSRVLPKAELHAGITTALGIPPSLIFSEYGMSELSSQAYDAMPAGAQVASTSAWRPESAPRILRFPCWARSHVFSPETGQEVADGETGLLRVFDLANVWSTMAIQTEDLAVRRGEGFELLGRAPGAEPRGCSLMPT